MPWYHPEARQRPIDRTWIYSVRQFGADSLEGTDLTEGVFEVDSVSRDGERQAKDRAILLARDLGVCKRTRRTRDPVQPSSVEWLENRLTETLRESYASWRDRTARFGRGVYPEPRWSTARLALEAAQYNRPDDLQVTDKRFYTLVRSALDRLKRRKIVVSSQGLDDQGRATTLWEPSA
jgi:hypothetical protein